MGWKGAIRSINASARRAERQQRMAFAEQARQNAYGTVVDFENLLEGIVSIHHNVSPCVDWSKIRERKEPKKPGPIMVRQIKAQNVIDNYTPGSLIKFLKMENWRRESLKKRLVKAIKNDAKETDKCVKEYEQDKDEWTQERAIIKRIDKKEVQVFGELFEKYFKPSSYFEVEGVKIFDDNGKIGFECSICSIDDVVPNQIYSLTKTGKLSVKDFPKTKRMQLYQDYACSVVLRIAREAFAILPIKEVYVNAVVNGVNVRTGYLEEQNIISTFIPQETISKLNLRNVDPSECLKNFKNEMKFSKTNGFEPVKSLVNS